MYRAVGGTERMQDLVRQGALEMGHARALLTELTRGDWQVRELTDLLGRPQSLVSYHLGQLRAGGLVSARRSSADGRDSYYRIDLARCRELLAETGLAEQVIPWHALRVPIAATLR